MPSTTDIEHWLRRSLPEVAVAGYSSFVAEAYHKAVVLEREAVVVAQIGAKQEYSAEDRLAGLLEVPLLDQVEESRTAGHCHKAWHLGMHSAAED